MRWIFVRLLALGLLCSGHLALAHPGSGIVVDREGNVYFVDTGSGMWKIGRDGKLTKLSAPAYHWLAIDLDTTLAATTLPYFREGDATVAHDPADPRIIVSSDFAVTVSPGGALYYPRGGSGERVQIFRLEPSGRTTVAATLPARTESGQFRWVNGLAATADGSVYYTENRAVGRITPQGELTTVVSNLNLSGCDSVPDVGPEQGTYFRGLAVDTNGAVYVAATGCRAVLKITGDKKVTTILRTSGPWSPTAVAVSGSDVYVLEYLHTPGDNRREWLPRVRKVSADGRVVTVAAIDR